MGLAIRLTGRMVPFFLSTVQQRTTSKVFRILAGQGLAFAYLSKQTGLHVRTLHNVANGTSQSRRARRKIEAALGVKLDWPQSRAVPQNVAGAQPQKSI